MKLRLKYLGFLFMFLTGSFLIVTWKAYDIFSQKYASSYQNMQIQDLEKQALLVQNQLENIQKLLQEQKDIEPLLRSNDIALLARIIREEGKWKAQWFEGQSGLRVHAKTVAQQIPFDSLSTAKKSWHFVNIKDHGKHLAYVIPVSENGRIQYYSFFFKPDLLARVFKGAPLAENITLISPQVGEIYTVGDRPADGLEKYKEIMIKKQTGLWPVNKQMAVISYFHPDLQLLFVKNIHLQNMVIESSAYLWALFAIIGLLVLMSLASLDLLFRSHFQRLALMTKNLRDHQKSITLEKNNYSDELAELEVRLNHLTQKVPAALATEAPVTAAAAKQTTAAEFSVDVNLLRPKAIQCLGYLNRLKAEVKEGQAPLQLLEKELRELRHLLEPQQSGISSQPYFNPLSESLQKNHDFLQDEITKEIDVESLLMSIRKPKRENHESQKL
jgi:hypothetical protein